MNVDVSFVGMTTVTNKQPIIGVLIINFSKADGLL